MASLLSLIQIYPAMGRMFGDLNSYLAGTNNPSDEERRRILQYKLDDIRRENEVTHALLQKALRQGLVKTCEKRDASTQTEYEPVTSCVEEELCLTTPGRGACVWRG